MHTNTAPANNQPRSRFPRVFIALEDCLLPLIDMISSDDGTCEKNDLFLKGGETTEKSDHPTDQQKQKVCPKNRAWRHLRMSRLAGIEMLLRRRDNRHQQPKNHDVIHTSDHVDVTMVTSIFHFLDCNRFEYKSIFGFPSGQELRRPHHQPTRIDCRATIGSIHQKRSIAFIANFIFRERSVTRVGG